MQKVSFYPVADHALLVQLGPEISDALTAQVLRLDRAIAANPPLGLRETVPAFVNLLAEFDPLVTDHQEMEAAIRSLFDAEVGPAPKGTEREVLVCYEDDLAPDLDAVSKATDMSPEAVINMHLSGRYQVGMYGFAPGYAYLSGVPTALQVPRKPAAIRDISAGSVVIAGPQCLVMTLTMPTGWCIIGRSPTEILRSDPDKPFLFDVGDSVKFRRVGRSAYDNLTKGRET
ncbi:allophanate hydrolase subunit 1 [Octadecabacter sp. CECT 8868]|uniref:5-oxoprolinase subunit B family protein n=1 Tax=Octadecabacter algicola TaxID=2909342 RepID=UPI001F355580|nr:allophanate hydrolase subunit 1 [Octadecabacter algicola]MCF2903917.1 allophanate hydrolase subunit 1 [Octadecabacter algicola]